MRDYEQRPYIDVALVIHNPPGSIADDSVFMPPKSFLKGLVQLIDLYNLSVLGGEATLAEVHSSFPTDTRQWEVGVNFYQRAYSRAKGTRALRRVGKMKIFSRQRDPMDAFKQVSAQMSEALPDWVWAEE